MSRETPLKRLQWFLGQRHRPSLGGSPRCPLPRVGGSEANETLKEGSAVGLSKDDGHLRSYDGGIRNPCWPPNTHLRPYNLYRNDQESNKSHRMWFLSDPLSPRALNLKPNRANLTNVHAVVLSSCPHRCFVDPWAKHLSSYFRPDALWVVSWRATNRSSQKRGRRLLFPLMLTVRPTLNCSLPNLRTLSAIPTIN